MPGIRVKLSVLFGLFISFILAAATLFNYMNQSRILEESFSNEIGISLKYINSAVLSMDSIRTNILLVEEMKLRIKEKKEELSKYRNYVYRRKDSLGNTLKSLGRRFGMKVQYDYSRTGYDTYYSIYLPEKEISAVEKRIEDQLRHKDGSIITPSEMKDIQDKGRAVAYRNRRIDALEKEIEAAGNAKPASLQALNSKLRREKNSRTVADRRFMKALKGFYEYSFRSLENTGTDSSSIRIITSGIDGDVNYDTGGLIRDGMLRFRPLMEYRQYKNDRSAFFSSPDATRNPEDAVEYDYSIKGNFYHVKYLPIFRNPSTYERIILINEDLEENRSKWTEFLKEDIRLSALFAEQSTKLRERLEYLRGNKIVPGKDEEYRSLYNGYRKLLAQRDESFSKLSPYSGEMERITGYYMDEIAKARAELGRIEKRISELKGDNSAGADDRAGSIEALTAAADDSRDRINKLKIEMENAREDIWQSRLLSAGDAIHYIRDAALLNFAILRQKNDPMAYRNYLRSPEIRRSEEGRFSTLRRWVIDAVNETGLPAYVDGMKNVPMAGDGILAYSRSEVEEYMWFLNSTPLAGDVSMFSIDMEGGLITNLKKNSVTGFNTILIDKTEGIRKIEANRDRMLFYSALIALFSIVLTYILAGFMVRRIGGIIGRASQAGSGDLTVEFPEKGLDEIEDLGVSLNVMIRGLREKEELKGEIAAAGEIQKILLPEKIPSTLEGYYSIGTFYRSMQGVGGDYYDIIELDDTRIFFCIGDVSSHGVGPAIVMSMLRAHLHGIIKRGSRDLVEILSDLNRQIYMETPSHIFVTLFTGIIDREKNEIEYCSAGHLRPAVYRYKKEIVEILNGGGLPVGMDDNDFFTGTISVSSTKLSPGDVFFQYTDGASEAMNSTREQFSDERIFGELKKSARKHPDVMIRRIAEEIERFTGKKIIDTMVSELNDDIAMIAFKRTR